MSVKQLFRRLAGGDNKPSTDKPIKAFSAKSAEIQEGSRRVRCIVSTPSTDREGDQIMVEGVELTRYQQNPVVLLQHRSDHIVARCVEIGMKGGRLEAVAEFPEPGVSDEADKTFRLIKAGLLNAVSIGMLPLEWEFIDDKNPWDGRRFTRSEMLEFSFVTLPANADAMILERCLKMAGGVEEMEKTFGDILDPDGPASPLAEEKYTDPTTSPETPPKVEETAGQGAAEDDNGKAARLRAVEVRRRKLLVLD